MKQHILILIIAGIACLFLTFSCSKEDQLPLEVMHGIVGDSLKVLAKGSPPFDISLSRNDSLLQQATLDSIGFVVFPITEHRSRPGEYLIAVESAYTDSSITIQINEKSAEQLFKEQQEQAAVATTVTTQPTPVSQNKNHSTDWSEWERSACFRKIWFRYKYRYFAGAGVYKYNFQVYNEYSPKVILRATLVDQRDKADLDRVKTNGGSLMGKTKEFHLGYRKYSYHNDVTLATDQPYFYIWRMQKSNPVSPYEPCDQ